MQDSSVPTSKLIAAALWTVAITIMAAAWVTWMAGDDPGLALMIAASAVLPAAGAGVAQIRCYSLRVCGLLRVMAADQGDRPPVRSIR